MYIKNNDITYFDSFGVEYIPKEIKKFISYNSLIKKIIRNIIRIQAYDSIMCGYDCIKFIDLMLASKKLTDYTNIFLPNDLPALESNMSTGITFFKNQISKIFGEFLGALLSKISVPLMKVAVPLAKHFLASSGMEATASGIDAEI